MIGEGLRYPLLDPTGRKALLVTTGAVLAIAIGVRNVVVLYPLVLAAVPAGVVLAAAIALSGAFSGVMRAPERPIRSIRGSTADGAIALLLAATTLALPVALLLGSVLSFAELDPDLDPEAPLFFLVGSTSALVLFFAVCYALPAIVRSALRRGRLRDAVDRALLERVLGSLNYFTAWTIGFPLVVLAWGLVSLALATGNLGGLLAAVCGGYLLLAGAHVFGSGYDDVPGIEGFDENADAS